MICGLGVEAVRLWRTAEDFGEGGLIPGGGLRPAPVRTLWALTWPRPWDRSGDETPKPHPLVNRQPRQADEPRGGGAR